MHTLKTIADFEDKMSNPSKSLQFAIISLETGADPVWLVRGDVEAKIGRKGVILQDFGQV